MFYKVIKSIIERSGGSMDKVNIKEFIGAINASFMPDPGNYWLGIKILKTPLDLMILQDIIFEKRPDVIIELGTEFGGSAYYMANIMELMKIDGKVISIDHSECRTSTYYKKDLCIDGKTISVDSCMYKKPAHSKLEFIQSDCMTVELPKLGDKVMVVLDCNHSADHVFKELEKFSSFVTPGQYIIVEDTDGWADIGGGPEGAIQKFLSSNKDFVVDESRERYGVSSNLGGYLLKVS